MRGMFEHRPGCFDGVLDDRQATYSPGITRGSIHDRCIEFDPSFMREDGPFPSVEQRGVFQVFDGLNDGIQATTSIL